VQLLHEFAKTRASFDDPNLVSYAGLVPVMALAERAGLAIGSPTRPTHRPKRRCGRSLSPSWPSSPT
jgi:hypothetical protein